MIKWIVNRVVCKKLNQLLDTHRERVEEAKQTISLWIKRLQRALECLQDTMHKLDDGKIDDNDIAETISSIQTIIKEW